MVRTARQRVLTALEGVSVGDAFGEQFFGDPALVTRRIADRCVPPAPWPWTDDTNMALSIAEVLGDHGTIEQDALAASFARRYDVTRGYGPAMHRVLRRIGEGVRWRDVVGSEFEGQGSFGNGAAMRAAPVGAWFADDLDAVVEQAAASAVVTHAHHEAVSGAIAVAVAAARAWRAQSSDDSPRSFLRDVIDLVPPSEVRDRLRRTERFEDNASTSFAAAVLGTGAELSAMDTVPFAVWIAATSLDDFEATLWRAVSEAVDIDTVAAIAGGIVAMRVGVEGIPLQWRARREPLPADVVAKLSGPR